VEPVFGESDARGKGHRVEKWNRFSSKAMREVKVIVLKSGTGFRQGRWRPVVESARQAGFSVAPAGGCVKLGAM